MNKNYEPVRIEILNIEPAYIEIKFLKNESKVKMGVQFLKKRIKAGFYEVVNQEKILPII